MSYEVDHSLHDCSLHGVEGIRAKLTDGREAEVELVDGKLEVVRYIDSEAEHEKAIQQAVAAAKQNWNSDAAEQLEETMRKMQQAAGGYGSDGKATEPKDIGGQSLQMMSDSVFGAQLQSVMNDNKFDRTLRGRTRGKVDMTRLYKAKTGATSIFAQKQSRRNKNYNVVLAVDESGSMNYGSDYVTQASYAENPIGIAGGVAQFLAEHLSRIDGVSLAIVGFNEHIRVHKEFDKKMDLTTIKDVVVRSVESGAGCNNDYEALEKCYELLKGRDGQNLVLFMSDGEPASFIPMRTLPNGKEMNLDDPKNLRALVKKHESLAATVGVGIMRTPNQTPQYIQVNDLDELKPKIISVLRREIKRG